MISDTSPYLKKEWKNPDMYGGGGGGGGAPVNIQTAVSVWIQLSCICNKLYRCHY